MSLSRLRYRSRQFWRAMKMPSVEVATSDLSPHLSPVQLTLFRRQQPSEQVHAWFVLQRLVQSGHTDPDLKTAALLHDIGKILYPLAVWERVLIVLVKQLLPRLAGRWGQGTPRGLQRPFVVAAQHADWGADLARQADASPRTVDLIRHHQDPLPIDDPLLIALQAADDAT
ncbi:MAG: HD domain-containing protein [Anaerolineales bacterium]|nr:HD domain-containing protein [Anaerolineales bacterium]